MVFSPSCASAAATVAISADEGEDQRGDAGDDG